MGSPNKKRVARLKRKRRVRKSLFGTEERPRLSVFRSGKHMYVQIVDDIRGHTLVSASTLHQDIRQQLPAGGKVGAAKLVGKMVAQRAMEKGVSKVVFDRNGFLYHGRVRAVATGAREQGLDF